MAAPPLRLGSVVYQLALREDNLLEAPPPCIQRSKLILGFFHSNEVLHAVWPRCQSMILPLAVAAILSSENALFA